MNRPKRLTIRDVAQLAGVSYQTVSRVINNSSGVAEDTRKRVLTIMRDNDYQPNHAAQLLNTSRSHTLEVITLGVQFGGAFAQSTKTMALAARQAGYSLLVAEASHDELAQTLYSAAARFIDGILLYAPLLTIDDQELLDMCHGIPLVRRDFMPTSKIPWVGFDQTYATELAVQHLLNLGHRQIAEITPPLTHINGRWRHRVLREILRNNDLEPGPMAEGDYTMRSAYEGVQQLLASGAPFTALIVGNDNMAVGAMHALKENGLRIPDDVSLISFNNSELASYIDPPLTTVEFKFNKQDELAIQYLIELIEHPETEIYHRLLMPSLVVRQSTGRLGNTD